MNKLSSSINNLILKYGFLQKLYAPFRPHVTLAKARKIPFKDGSVGAVYADSESRNFSDFVEIIPADELNSLQPSSDDPPIFNSVLCKQTDFSLPLYQYWCMKFDQEPELKRKQWEFVYIVQGLYERGYLNSGSKGLGFGVGKEPLVSLFASMGCEITATDISEEEGRQLGWIQTGQHVGDNYQSLWKQDICTKAQFKKNVSFQHLDMNHIPNDLNGYDFCWSACAFEHLGSIEKGLQFVENSLNCLKPGGLAIHTSEYNLSSDTDTIDDNPHLVLFRKRDYQSLIRRLEANGHTVFPVSFDTGDGYVDNFVDIPPYYRKNMHTNLLIGKYVSTSFGLIIMKG